MANIQSRYLSRWETSVKRVYFEGIVEEQLVHPLLPGFDFYGGRRRRLVRARGWRNGARVARCRDVI